MLIDTPRVQRSGIRLKRHCFSANPVFISVLLSFWINLVISWIV
jgi:hypothetical protein